MRYELALIDSFNETRIMEKLFESMFEDFRKSLGEFESVFTGSELEVKEEKDKYLVSAKLDGFRKKDIKVRVDDNIMYIRAETESKNKKTKETSYKCYSRVLYLGDNVDTGGIKASFKNGNLSIELLKSKETKNIAEIKVE